MTKTTTSKTADATYQERRKEVEILLLKIGQAVRQHAKAQAKEPRDWGYAGDLGHAVELLTEVNAFLRGEQE